MDAYRLPMFPLGTPLVPGSLLPLQIFEPRYQQMISDVLESSEPEFGVVLIERGHEVGGEISAPWQALWRASLRLKQQQMVVEWCSRSEPEECASGSGSQMIRIPWPW